MILFSKFLRLLLFVSFLLSVDRLALAEIKIIYANNVVAPDLICPIVSSSVIKKSNLVVDPLEPPDDIDIQDVMHENLPRGYSERAPEVFAKKSSVPSIGLWGDSHVAAYFFTDELIKRLGVDSKQVYQKFIPPSMGRAGIRLPIKKFCKSAGWNYIVAYKDVTYNSPRGLIELEGSIPNSYIWIDFRKNGDSAILSELKIPISTSSNLTKLGISIDGNEEQIIEVHNTSESNLISIESQFSFSTVQIRLIAGQIKIAGFLPIYNQQATLYFDTFGIPGATMNGWSKVGSADSYGVVGSNHYDVVILEYGTNEGNDSNFDSKVYRKNLIKNLEIVKNRYPEASCVLIGPTDRGILIRRSLKKSRVKVSKNDLLKYSQRHNLISSIQEEEAKRFGCSFWNWQDSMGGLGSSYKWLKQNPQLMSKDLTHLTVQGYQLSAQKFIQKFNLSKLFEEN